MRGLLGAFVLAALTAHAAFGATTPAKPKPDKPAAAKPKPPAGASFESFLQSLWPFAQAEGISRATFDEAFDSLTIDASIVALTKKQSEFSKPIWSYLAGAVSSQRIERGRAAAEQYADSLARIESQYGVPKEIVLGVWGMETNYGSFTGDKDVIRSLATLAYVRYRGTFFRDELMQALRIIDDAHIPRSRIRGSWAGAMGHTQFMPSSFMKYAVGGKNIWGSAPDALASTANYLAQKGWQSGLPWGVEVSVPTDLDYRTVRRSFSAWASAGVTAVNGGALPRSGEALLFMPAGAKGPAFLLTDNFAVIKTYNMSDAYALGVAHLGDRVMGRPRIQGTWPAADPLPSKALREDVQRQLRRLGFYDQEIDGRLGSGTRDAVRRFQLAEGVNPADGYATAALLARMKAAKR
ncbi:lytic murein transglycosylase [Terrarubrum flagellatum]|uniref:lytic murein transglycosylase n=1 Tax=Terrirubrum flagellatum TaxID=2895980 RepID=UPI0031451F18